MDHEQALQLLPGYIDEELSLSESLDFERHLATCEECRRIYEQDRQVNAQLRQADLRMDAPPELVKRIKAALPGPPRSGNGCAIGSAGGPRAGRSVGHRLARWC